LMDCKMPIMPGIKNQFVVDCKMSLYMIEWDMSNILRFNASMLMMIILYKWGWIL